MKRLFVLVAAALVGGILQTPPADAQGVLDHLLCYRVKDKLLPAASADLLAQLQPEFSQKGCVLVKPIQFCVPATKINVQPDPTNPNIVGQPLKNDYVCYIAKCAKGTPPRSKLVIDQFGRRQQRKYIPFTVCVPAEKTTLSCGFLGTSKVCGGACPDATQTCAIDPATNVCACTQKDTCGGKPDKSGTCGGTCTDPTQKCLPDIASPTHPAPVCRCKDPDPPLCGINLATGQCGGTCPNPADTCTLDAAGVCTCLPSSSPCGLNPDDKTCAGACPKADQTCLPDATTNACSCQPASGCGTDPLTGNCSGDCPNVGEQCLYSDTAGCSCQPTPCTSNADGTCGGTCPSPDQKCEVDSSGACNCQPPSCGGVVPQCSGACPTGLTCGIIVGTKEVCGCTTPQ